MLKSVAGFLAVSALAVSTATAAPEDIKFPKDYENKFLNYLNLDRGNGKQVGRIFANDTAVSGVQKNGEFPDGSVLVMEVSKAKKGKDGKPLKSSLDRLIRDGKAAVVVMRKIKGSDKGLPEELRNDDWEFAAFSPSGKFLKKDYNKCRACHAPLEDAKHVFSYDHIQKANLKDYLINASYDGGKNRQSSLTGGSDAAMKLLNSISAPGTKKAATTKASGRSAQALLDSISAPGTKKNKKVVKAKKANQKQVDALLASISTPAKSGKKVVRADKRNVNKLLDSISTPGKKTKKRAKAASRFKQNIAIRKVIQRQLDAFRRNNAGRAFSVAAPTIRTTFRNSANFMRMVRSSFPAVYFSKRAIFPKMTAVRGKNYTQRVILEDRRGNMVVAKYQMVKVRGHWRIAGCEVAEKRYH